MTKRARWVVRDGEGPTLADVLRHAGGDADAVREGRVFVGRRRALSGDEAVAVGDEVFLAPRAKDVRAAAILYDQDGLVAADKPADLVTIPGHEAAASSLLADVARTLKVHPLTLHPTSRLDRGVSGVVVFARTPAAADRLARARERGDYARRYVAIASKAPEPEAGAWDAPIGKAADPRHREVAGRDATTALTRYAVVARAGAWGLCALDPVTGRTHQLRVHASHAGAPLLGDRAYGGPTRATLPNGTVLSFGRIALHAARVRVPRADGTPVEIASPVPAALLAWWRATGGTDDAWELARTAATGTPG